MWIERHAVVTRGEEEGGLGIRDSGMETGDAQVVESPCVVGRDSGLETGGAQVGR